MTARQRVSSAASGEEITEATADGKIRKLFFRQNKFMNE
jgi:hypothetical protein